MKTEQVITETVKHSLQQNSNFRQQTSCFWSTLEYKLVNTHIMKELVCLKTLAGHSEKQEDWNLSRRLKTEIPFHPGLQIPHISARLNK